MSRPIVTILVSLTVVLAITGTGAALESADSSERTHPEAGFTSQVDQDEQNTTETVPDDPPNDTIGWENGYWYNETIDVNQSDGLTAVETEAYVSRAMARVEHLRQREFLADVDVEVISRDELRNRTTEFANASGETSAYWHWNNQVWEGLFIVGEDENVSDTFDELYGGAVLGYYDSETDELVVVSEDPETLVIDNVTLVHELVHALQDQHYNLSQAKYGGETQDEQLATGALIEGDATYIEELYIQKCEQEWDCVPTPESNASDGSGTFNVGLLVLLLSQYSDGMAFVSSLVNESGWERIDSLYEDPPEATEQIIHVEPNESSVPIEFEDTAQNGWELFDDQGVNGSDTVGEASIYTMFWYQGFEYDISIVDQSAFLEPDGGAYDWYNYTSPPSTGWANDRLFPYQKDGQFGYVWVTEWDREADASQFQEAYVAMITGHGAEQVGENTWVIECGPYADAFSIEQNGTTVTIVNAPTAPDVHDIRPGSNAGTGNTTTTQDT